MGMNKEYIAFWNWLAADIKLLWKEKSDRIGNKLHLLVSSSSSLHWFDKTKSPIDKIAFNNSYGQNYGLRSRSPINVQILENLSHLKISFTWLDAAEDRGDGVECELSSKLVL